MKIVSVIPFKKGIPKGDLTYFTSLDIHLGNIVSVPVRSKETLALVVSIEELKETKSNIKGMNFKLRKVTEDKGDSVFLKELMYTIFDINKFFAQHQNNSISSLIPNIFIEKYDKILKIKNKEEKIIDDKRNLRAEKFLFQYGIKERISVYKTLVRESFARGKSVFMVLPTEFDIEIFYKELSRGIEQFTFSVHSGITPKKNLTAYEEIITSSHPVLIIGTPPFLAIPRRDIGTIILEHENSNAYKMIRRPYFDLRVFVETYASKIKARLIMADEILRFETIGRMERDNFLPLHPLSFRIDFDGKIEVVEAAYGEKERKEKEFRIFSDETIEEITQVLKSRKNVFIFSLRKGLATMTVCRDCGESVNCEECQAPLVLYLSHKGDKRMFVCNRCETDRGGEKLCDKCGSWNLMPLGIGTDTVYEEINKFFPKEKILKLDKESAKTALGAKKIVKDFNENKGSILIGTEMAFFYLKNKIPLSLISSFDSLWSIPNFKMSEKIIQIVLSAIGNTTEKLIIQTKNEKDGAILAIKSGNLLSFVREELEIRKKLGYPPFKRFIKIVFQGDKTETLKAKKILEEMFEEYSPLIYNGFVPRLKDKYVTNALIKIDPLNWSLPEFSLNSSFDENLFVKISSLPSSFEVLVDPEDLL